jgi:hypothetical protein
MEYYNAVRTHLSLSKDAPNGRAIQRSRPDMNIDGEGNS